MCLNLLKQIFFVLIKKNLLQDFSNISHVQASGIQRSRGWLKGPAKLCALRRKSFKLLKALITFCCFVYLKIMYKMVLTRETNNSFLVGVTMPIFELASWVSSPGVASLCHGLDSNLWQENALRLLLVVTTHRNRLG